MKEEGSGSERSGTFKCTMCNQSFQTQQELREHNRSEHNAGEQHHSDSGAEQQFPQSGRNPGAERQPGMDRSQTSGGQRKGPQSEQQEEQPQQTRKRAAS